jgi:hypothetical protein
MGSQMTAAEAGAYLFERLSNAERINLLKQLYTTEVGGTILADRLDWFVSGYGKWAESRNILMHSEPHGASYNALQLVSALELRKASKNNPRGQSTKSREVGTGGAAGAMEILPRYVRDDRGDRGNVGIIRSPIRASILPDSH